ncbi:MAG TPA: hypothetical protein VHO48_14700, partial [Anaerolineaceae bacterium]|nr:hypothetical protein [Anaerolineaceae bacterium]
ADQAVLPQDEEVVQYALKAVRELNQKYQSVGEPTGHETGLTTASSGGTGPFYLFHRSRLWNPSEGKWIGWERKRGKLHEFNQILRSENGAQDPAREEIKHSFTVISDGLHAADQCIHYLQRTRYVITLDADSILPRGAGSRLIGALAHPLNQAVFDEETGRITSGYSVLQPRMEIHPRSVNHSWFTRIFAGDTGLDLYTLAVSDAYNDLFGEGIFVGKGIYDVDAFMRSVDDYIPENSVLSHDLLEGVMGRAALVTDITMVEDYPQSYFVQAVRLQRWIRGDWQLLPWLFPSRRSGPNLSVMDRWKIFDNLRRSLLAPTLLFILVLGLLFTPSLALLWILFPFISLGIPLFTSLTHSTLQVIGGEQISNAMRPLRWNIMRWALGITFLPYEAFITMSAIITTLVRMLITRRNLLQWTTAAQSAQLFRHTERRGTAWLTMSLVSITSFLLTVAIQVLSKYDTAAGRAQWFTLPLLILWYTAPLIAWWISQPVEDRAVPLNQDQLDLLRRIARRTWGFFERYVGPEDHWLPPDHFQETPLGVAAHRTSPTNMGLLLTSTLAAYDLGYIGHLDLATRLSTTLDTFSQMERFRGHFINWYDTLTLQPLNPRYISTVDSGNLAASLIVTAQACKRMPEETIFRWNLWQGYLDSLSVLEETLHGIRIPDINTEVDELTRLIADMQEEVKSVQHQRSNWYPLFLKVSGSFWRTLSAQLIELVKNCQSALNLSTLSKLQETAAQTERQHLAVQHTITELVPWIPLFEHYPPEFDRPPFAKTFSSLRSSLPNNMAFGQIPEHIKNASQSVATLHCLLDEPPGISEVGDGAEQKDRLAREWLGQLTQALEMAQANARSLVEKFNLIAGQAEQYVQEMDFSFLFHQQRCVFHIGFNMVTGQLDQNYYDLLASEARIASIIAIAKEDVPQTHWLHLNRP